MTQWPDLNPTLAELRWAIAGAVATRRYMPERATQDLDILVAADEAAEAVRRLRTAGFRANGTLAIGDPIPRSPDGVPVDLIEANEPWAIEALEEAAHNRESAGSPVLPLPYLVLMKMLAARGRDIGDVTTMLAEADDAARDHVRRVVRRLQPDLSEDLESLIVAGTLERGAPP